MKSRRAPDGPKFVVFSNSLLKFVISRDDSGEILSESHETGQKIFSLEFHGKIRKNMSFGRNGS